MENTAPKSEPRTLQPFAFVGGKPSNTAQSFRDFVDRRDAPALRHPSEFASDEFASDIPDERTD